MTHSDDTVTTKRVSYWKQRTIEMEQNYHAALRRAEKAEARLAEVLRHIGGAGA